MTLGGYVLYRVLLLVPVLAGISLIVFFIMALLPGDPAQALLGAYATPENLANLRADMGLDEPLVSRYFIWLGNLLEGNFGHSYSLDRPVLDIVIDRLGPTLLLAGTALILCAIFGLAAGVISAVHQYGWQDKMTTFFVLIGISTPTFWLGLLFVLFFAVKLNWFPTGGMYPIYGAGGWLTVLHHLVLPAVCLAVVATGVIARLTRSSMLEVLRRDFVTTARAKGLDENTVVYKHAFKNALVTVIPVVGIQAGFVLGSAVYIETVFQWPGIGSMIVTAILSRDILLVQGAVIVVAACYVLINLLTDVLQRTLDPRIVA